MTRAREHDEAATDGPDNAVRTPALEAIDVRAGARTLSIAAAPGALTLWPGDDGPGTAELTLALSGRFRLAGGTVRVLDEPATPDLLRREVVLARVLDAVEPEPRLRVPEFLASCRVLHGSRHNRISAERALSDVGLAEVPRARMEELTPSDAVRVCVAGALLARPVAVTVDRIDRGVAESDWPGLRADLQRAADLTGVAIVASCTRTAEVG